MSSDRQRAYIVLAIGVVLVVAFMAMAAAIINYQQSLLNLEQRLLQEQAEHRCRKEALMMGLYEAHGMIPPGDPDLTPLNCDKVYAGQLKGTF